MNNTAVVVTQEYFISRIIIQAVHKITNMTRPRDAGTELLTDQFSAKLAAIPVQQLQVFTDQAVQFPDPDQPLIDLDAGTCVVVLLNTLIHCCTDDILIPNLAAAWHCVSMPSNIRCTVCSFSDGSIILLDIKNAPFQTEQEFIISSVYLNGSISVPREPKNRPSSEPSPETALHQQFYNDSALSPVTPSHHPPAKQIGSTSNPASSSYQQKLHLH